MLGQWLAGQIHH